MKFTDLLCKLGFHDRPDWCDSDYVWYDLTADPDTDHSRYCCKRCLKECGPKQSYYYVPTAEGRCAPYRDDWTPEEATLEWMHYDNSYLPPNKRYTLDTYPRKFCLIGHVCRNCKHDRWYHPRYSLRKYSCTADKQTCNCEGFR